VDWSVIKDWWPLGLLLLQGITSAAVYWSRAEFARKDEVATLKATVDDTISELTARMQGLPPAGEWTQHRDRVQQAHHQIELLEQRVEHLPNSADFDRLQASLATLAQGQARVEVEIEAVKGSVDRAADAVTRIHQYLLERGK
jgi:uncharacterized protein YPO0396